MAVMVKIGHSQVNAAVLLDVMLGQLGPSAQFALDEVSTLNEEAHGDKFALDFDKARAAVESLYALVTAIGGLHDHLAMDT